MRIISLKFSSTLYAAFKVESHKRDSKIRNTFNIIEIYDQVLSPEVVKVFSWKLHTIKMLLKLLGINLTYSVLFTIRTPGRAVGVGLAGRELFITAAF